VVTLESEGGQVELVLNILYSNVIPGKIGLVTSRELLLIDSCRELALIGSLELGDVGTGTRPL
jgi:hypothetical protein